MQIGRRALSEHELLIVVVHENFDFVRDITKKIKQMNLNCEHVCRMESLIISRIKKCSPLVIIDVDTNDRHLRLVRRIFGFPSVEERIFFVNARRYEKGDWRKIHTYCEMIAVQNRLWHASRQD
jgi:hypothetical protein